MGDDDQVSQPGPTDGWPGSAHPSARLTQGRHREIPTRRQRWQTALIALLAVIAVAVGIAVGITTFAANRITGSVSRVADAFPSGERPAPAQNAGVNFLVAAAKPDGVTADAVLLVHFTDDKAHVQVVFLPLDAWLTPAATTPAMAFGSGGAAALVEAVETTTGIRMDHYAQIDFDGLRRITDALGGVDVDVPQAYGSRGYDFPVGRQHLDGEAAVAYVREDNPAARATTATRFQAMIQALFDRLSQQGLLSDFGPLATTVGEVAAALTVDTTLASSDLVHLAWSGRGTGKPDFLVVPVVGPGTQGGQPVQLLDETRAGALWVHLRADTLDAHLGDFR